MKDQRNAPLLFADDDENDTYFFRLALEAVEVFNPLITFKDGQEVIDYLQRADRLFPALLVLDLKMPRVSGFDVLEWLRARPGIAGFPIVVLSASQQEADIKWALELGATEYKVKPAGNRELAGLVLEFRDRWLAKGAEDLDLVHQSKDKGSPSRRFHMLY
jgi:two-component system response regulator